MANIFSTFKKKIEDVLVPTAQPVNDPTAMNEKIRTGTYGKLGQATAAQKESVIHQIAAPVKAPSGSIGVVGDAFNDTIAQAGRFVAHNVVTQPAMEVAQTIRQKATGNRSSYTPGTGWEKAVFGDNKIQSLQENNRTTREDVAKNQHVGSAAPVIAGANTAVHVVNDIPVVGAALKYGGKAVKIGVKQAPKLAEDAMNAIRIAAKQPAKVSTRAPEINAQVSKELKTRQTKNSYINPNIKTAPTGSFVPGPNTDSSFDFARVKHYEDLIKAGKPIDPVVVKKYDGVDMLEDGKHRQQAAINLKVKDLPYVVERPKANGIMGTLAQKAQDFAESLPQPGLSMKEVHTPVAPVKTDNDIIKETAEKLFPTPSNTVKVTNAATEDVPETKTISELLPDVPIKKDPADIAAQISKEEKTATVRGSGMIVEALQKQKNDPEKYLSYLRLLNGREDDVADATKGASRVQDEVQDAVPVVPSAEVPAQAEHLNRTRIQEKFDVAPDPKTATGEEARTFIGDITDTANKGALAIDDYLKKSGGSYEQFSREIQEANRNGVDPSEETQQLYNRFIKPSLDRARVFGGEKTGEQRWYLPQTRPVDATAETANFGGTLVNAIDIGDTGFAARRTNAIPLDELDHSPDALTRYFTKNASLPYKDNLAAESVVKAAQDSNAERVAKGLEPLPEPTHEEALKVVQETKKLGQEISKQADEGGILTSGTDKIDMVDKINNLGKLKKTPQFNVDNGLSFAGRQFSSSDEIYKATYADADGVIYSIGDGTGFNRYNQSDAIGHKMQEMAYSDGMMNEDMLRKELGNQYADSGAPTSQIQGTIDTVIAQLNGYDKSLLKQIAEADAGTLNLKPETLAMDRADIIARAHRNIAREQMSSFLEGANITSKQLRKNINQDAAKMLIQDKAVDSLATKMVNLATGAVYKGALGYNPISAVQNLTELRRAYSEFGEADFAKALARAGKDPKITARYGIKETVSSSAAKDGKIQVVKKGDLAKPMGMFNATEEYKDAVLLHGLEAKYKGQGLDGTQLTQAVLKDFNKLGFKGGKGGALGFNKSKTGRVLGQFMQYQIKDWKLTGSKAIDAIGVRGTDEATKKAAQAYLARKVPSDIATYLVLNAAYGATIQNVMNMQNPFAGRFLDDNAGMDEKIIDKISSIGGPLAGMTGDMYLAIRKAYRDANESGESVHLNDVVNNTIKKDAALFVPGGNQFFNKTGGFLADQQRGYNESADGRARFAATDDPVQFARGLIAGKYSTDEAKEYYGKQGIAGDLPGRGGEQKSPVSVQFQKQVDAANGNKVQIKGVIDRSREVQDEKKTFFKANPALESVYKTMNKTTYNPTTKKNESDVLSPEKWKLVSGDTSGKLYDFMKQKAENNNKDFGTPIDPIYKIAAPSERKQALSIRSMPTGDDMEQQEILRATTDWYPKFEKAEADYYTATSKLPEGDSDSNYGSSERKQAWTDLKYPEQSQQVKDYYKLKTENPDLAKSYYKANADTLSADFDAYKQGQLKWTNEKRKLEGYPPIGEKEWNNVTFGYEDDEKKVQTELSFKLGNSYGGGGGDDGIRSANFGSAKSVTIKDAKIKKNTIKISKKNTKKIKVSYKKG